MLKERTAWKEATRIFILSRLVIVEESHSWSRHLSLPWSGIVSTLRVLLFTSTRLQVLNFMDLVFTLVPTIASARLETPPFALQPVCPGDGDLLAQLSIHPAGASVRDVALYDVHFPDYSNSCVHGQTYKIR